MPASMENQTVRQVVAKTMENYLTVSPEKWARSFTGGGCLREVATGRV